MTELKYHIHGIAKETQNEEKIEKIAKRKAPYVQSSK